MKTLYITPASPWENGYNESFNGSLRDGEIFYSLGEAKVLIEGLAAALQHDPPAQQPWLPTAGPGNRDTAIAAFRFRYAPPPGGNGEGGNNALTFNLDHSAGADQKRAARQTFRGGIHG